MSPAKGEKLIEVKMCIRDRSMILETYQEQHAIVQPDPPGQSFATVGTVYEDGIALIVNGAEAESLKHYKCNAAVRFTRCV